MANDKSFKIKNGLSATRYLGSNGAETAGTEGYSLAGASYDNKSFSVASQETTPRGFEFNADGTKVYVVGNANNTVYQYSLSTAYDISTASYDSVSFNLSGQSATVVGIRWNSDGTKMFTCDLTGDDINEYTLTTGFDLSSASFVDSFSIVSEDNAPLGFVFNADGTKFYLVGNNSDTIYQYSLTTAYDISTASYDSKSLNTSTVLSDTVPCDMAFNSDGTKMFVAGSSNEKIFQLSLTTAYDISTASYDDISFSTQSQESNILGFTFHPDGSKFYIVGSTNDTIYQYSAVDYTQTLDLSTGGTFSFTPSGATTVSFTNPPASGIATGFTLEVNNTGGYALTWPSSIKWHEGTAPTATASKEVYTFITTDGGTSYYGKLAGSNVA